MVVVVPLATTIASLARGYHVTTLTDRRSVPRSAVTVRRSSVSADSAVGTTAALLPTDASIGQEYRKVSQGSSPGQLQSRLGLEKQLLVERQLLELMKHKQEQKQKSWAMHGWKSIISKAPRHLAG